MRWLHLIKTNLPVIFLKDVVLLPNNDLRVEFSSSKDKLMLKQAENKFEGNLLFINLKNPKEEKPSINDLPKVGVIGRIKTKIELPNGIVRVVITGVNRVEVIEYIDNLGYIEAFIKTIDACVYDAFEASALKRILLRDLNNYIELSSYMSNSVIGRIDGNIPLDAVVDIVTAEVPLVYKDKVKYIYELNPLTRTRLLIEDLNKEIETIKLEDTIEDDLKHSLDKNQKEFILREKIKLIKKELGEVDLKDEEVNRLREKVALLHAPVSIKKRLEKELGKYELTPTTSPEITTISNYIDMLLSLPWNVLTKDNNNLDKVLEYLDKSHYGLEEVKMRILEYIAVRKHTNNNISNIICLVGPPGVGKTTLAKSIAKALNKKFTKISVGGVSDEAELIGHRRTYVGANAGKIITGLKKCGSSNPVFLIDEIDKMTKDIKGDPASCLLDILDKEQNANFVDNYIEEEFDLSNVMFILTANDCELIPSALRDRLEIIKISSYTKYEKLDICKNYIIKNLEEEYNLKSRIIFEKDAIMDIISLYTKESGVRELQRQISKIFRKVIINIVSKKEKNNVLITSENLVNYLGNAKYPVYEDGYEDKSGVVNALAYTPYGGATLKVSCCKYAGDGKVVVTGMLGSVMKESVDVSLSYIKSCCDMFGIDSKVFRDNDFHIHFEDASTSKDGPSAGIVIVTALLSLIKDKTVSNEVSMTGEITLRGAILEVGGIKEKLISALSSNIKKVYLPYNNIKDVNSLSKEITDNLDIVYVNDYMDIYKDLF